MLRFVVAFQAEARPLVERFGMEPAGDGPFAIYRGDDAWLIVSGLGKAAAAAATAYLHLFSGGEMGRAWLNVGLGGHSARPWAKASSLTRSPTGRAAPPGIPNWWWTARGPPCRCSRSSGWRRSTRCRGCTYGEAAGFFPTACRFSVAELVHCFKVVSDNSDATLSRRMSSTFLEHLIARNLGDLEAFARDLAAMAEELARLTAIPFRFPAPEGKAADDLR